MSGLTDLHDVGVVAVIRAPSAAGAVRAAEALVEGGVTGIEVTYSTPGAADAIRTLVDRLGDRALVGAGTVLTPDQVAEATAAGSRFLVSPGHTPELAASMCAAGPATLLGAFTPSEVMTAVAAGADAVKIFPAATGGVAHLKALRGPFPDVPFVPTGGVSVDNIAQWRAAEVVAVGAGGDLCSAAAIAAEDWDGIAARATAYAAAWQEAGR